MGNVFTRRTRRIPAPTPTSPDVNDPLWQLSQPTGLYPDCKWSPRKVYYLVSKSMLAPRYKGEDDPTLPECPICFLVLISFFFTLFLEL